MAKWLTEDPAMVWPGVDQAGLAARVRLIEKAERIIAQRFKTVDQRVERGELDSQVIADVVEAMVDRAVQAEARGGVGKLSYPEIGVEFENGAAGAQTLLFLTMDELILLTPPASEGAFTIRPRTNRGRPPW